MIEQKIASLEAKDPASGDTERSLKDRFSGAVVMGDSISSGFSEYDVLNASSVVAKRGYNWRDWTSRSVRQKAEPTGRVPVVWDE